MALQSQMLLNDDQDKRFKVVAHSQYKSTRCSLYSFLSRRRSINTRAPQREKRRDFFLVSPLKLPKIENSTLQLV